MKVGGTLGNEDSIVVESSTLAVAKSAPAVQAFGLFALDRHAHLNVLAYLRPNWVQWRRGGGRGGEREGERGREREEEEEEEEGEEWSHIGCPRLRPKKTHKPTTSLMLSFAVRGTFRVEQARGGLFRRKSNQWAI
jgi:hypothetical protein